ncbi:MAG: 2-deoxyribose-5-phosphate aldolase [Bacteroidetes bacterium]|nr:2-deoxyribose-5-phosphate aldolase [Bacteroidota bacterium]
MPLNAYIDHTILKPTTLVADIEKLCAEAVQYGFAAVCVPPNFVKTAKALVAGSSVKVATVIGFPKNADWAYLANELGHILPIVRSKEKVIKIIIESGVLTNDEIIKCCELYGVAGIDYLKTSTGYAEKGATIEAVQLFKKHLPSNVQIKASGGIRDYAFASALVAAGATRLGCSASVAIVTGAPATGNY